jgi:hypothetical protein
MWTAENRARYDRIRASEASIARHEPFDVA